jgi:hypothetical protein
VRPALRRGTTTWNSRKMPHILHWLGGPYGHEPRDTPMKKPKRKLTAAERRARRERKKNFMTVFLNGKQKRVPRPQLIDGLTVDEFIARNADPIYLHQNELWEYMTPDDEI